VSRIVFLFGAGASYGATHVVPEAPPLGAGVYDVLANRFPAVWGPQSRLARYAAGLRQDFEKTMFEDVCRWEPSLNILEWHRPMAMFFAGFRPDGTGQDLYSRLLAFLLEQRLLRASVFGSLNYDCIFERAALRLGLRPIFGLDGSDGNAVRVLKIHGSSTFVTEDIERGRAYLTNAGSHLECKLEAISPSDDLVGTLERLFGSPGPYHYPVISLYAPGKDSLVCGVKIQEIRNAWADTVRVASAVAVVGARANPNDTHVWEPIRQTAATKLLYLGGAADFPLWKSANDRFELVGTRFDEAFDSLCGGLESSAGRGTGTPPPLPPRRRSIFGRSPIRALHGVEDMVQKTLRGAAILSNAFLLVVVSADLLFPRQYVLEWSGVFRILLFSVPVLSLSAFFLPPPPSEVSELKEAIRLAELRKRLKDLQGGS